MNDREKLMKLLEKAGIDFYIELTQDGEQLAVRDRYNGFRCRVIFDGEGNLLSMQDERN